MQGNQRHLVLKRAIQAMFLFCCLLLSFNSFAEPTPRWVKKGVKELNKKRSNDSYSFHIFHQYDADQRVFEWNKFKPLIDYVDSTYNVSAADLSVDSIPANGSLPTTYMVSFDKDGRQQTVYARLVDQYMKFSDYADNYFEYNLYQLYAISDPTTSFPDFDKFSLKRKYGAKPILMSIIPGLGQIYKGETAKGYSFMGIEAAMIASIIYSTNRVHHWVGLANKHPEFYDSYQSKAKTFRQWRMFCYIAGGGLYVYNLFDAAFAKGARYVEVKRNKAPNAQISFSPVFSPDLLGFGVNFNL